MRLARKSTQTTIFGEFVPVLPKVRTSRGYLLDWDRNRIVRQIMEESRLVEVFYGYEGADEETAQDIARGSRRRSRCWASVALRPADPRDRQHDAP